ncbi:hypothetical protein JX265_006122 [Neoarthrinium moseri]|uniref:Xylanolytic transcriptional activator regulatory domain-containing protein n=1 Tax=Neoarthrinium moseri TaxID=1658444 RepID=A0A9P9WMZ0_9PEZI|nr:hypothetical protein JX265_006122 [Neoarthrinium moseri]
MSDSGLTPSRLGTGSASGQPGSFSFTPFTFDQASVVADPMNRKSLSTFDSKAPSPAPLMASVPTAAERRENAKAKRRVPPSQRKRTKLSCDACKARRCKCLRITTALGSEDGQVDGALTPCKNCVDTGIECVTTLPRKQRIYGSVENLDRRYRALDALVSGMFPQLGPDATAEDIATFGKENGIVMPVLGDEPDGVTSPASMAALVSPVSPPSLNRKIGDEHSDSGHSSIDFYKDTSGRSHYVGPSGSLATFARIRHLIARRLQASPDPDTRRRVEHVSSKSVTDAIASSFNENPDHVGLWSGDSMTSNASPDKHLERSSNTKSNVPSNNGDSQYWIPTSKIKLPTKHIADACVEAFFENVHPSFMCIHRATFQQHYEDLWKTSSGHQSVSSASRHSGTYVSVGWLCCLYMIFILGSRTMKQNPTSLEFQRTYFDCAKQLPSKLTGSTLPNISALMLLALYCLNINDRTGSWAFLGLACRLAVSLGMHRECVGDGINTLTREIRKRVWWTLYDCEQHLCCSLGRPSAIDDVEINVGVADEELLQCDISLPAEYSQNLVYLLRLLGTIRRSVHEPSVSVNTILPREVQLLRCLVLWKAGLPGFLRPTPPNEAKPDPRRWRRIIMMNVQYQKSLSLLTRRFLLQEVESADRKEDLGVDAFAIISLGEICVTSAMRMASLLVDLWKAKMFNGITAIDTYYAYLASIQLSLRLLEPRYLVSHQRLSKVPNEEKFRPSATPALKSSLDYEIEALITQSQLVETYSVAELTDAVRQLNDVFQTVDMCGFSAKCSIISAEFGKAVGAIDGEPSSTLFNGKLGQNLEKVEENRRLGPTQQDGLDAANYGSFYTGNIPPTLDNSDGYHSQDSRFVQTDLAGAYIQPQAMGMNYDYGGVFNTNSLLNVSSSQPPDIQWDQVLQAADWQQPHDMFNDMTSSAWSWPHQSNLAYDPMAPPQ